MEQRPFVNIRIYEGQGKRKEEVARRVTEAICDATRLPAGAVAVVIEDLEANALVSGPPGERLAT